MGAVTPWTHLRGARVRLVAQSVRRGRVESPDRLALMEDRLDRSADLGGDMSNGFGYEATGVGRRKHVGQQGEERVREVVVLASDVENGTTNAVLPQCRRKRVFVDEAAAGAVHENGIWLHGIQRRSVEKVLGPGRVSGEAHHHVAGGDQLAE
jgi:hypothetical protein